MLILGFSAAKLIIRFVTVVDSTGNLSKDDGDAKDNDAKQ